MEEKELLNEVVKIHNDYNMPVGEVLEKVKGIMLKNIFTTKQKENIDMNNLIKKLEEEQKEVINAYKCENKENLTEELLDEIQMCVNILEHLGIDVGQAIINHNVKLFNRGWKFNKRIFEVKI